MIKILTKNQKRILITFCVVAILFTVLAFASTPSRALEVHFLDVGQGDSIFVQTPHRTQLLIDGGSGSQVLEKVGSRMPFYDRNLDFVILTHIDKDHAGGLIDILDKFQVGAVLVSTQVVAETQDTDLAQEFFAKIEESGVRLVRVEAGDRFWIDEDIYFDILWPSKDVPSGLSDNEKSLVLKLVYKDDSFLLTGDTEKFAEYSLATNNIDLGADVLKVGHHGSNSSSAKYFLDKVQAKIAVIQVGKNSYGHPHGVVLERLQNTGMQILRNDLNGIISMYTYGNSF